MSALQASYQDLPFRLAGYPQARGPRLGRSRSSSSARRGIPGLEVQRLDFNVEYPYVGFKIFVICVDLMGSNVFKLVPCPKYIV